MIELTLDGALGLDAIHDQLAETLHFPDYYGRNLDALFDCLTEIEEDARIRLINPDALERQGNVLQILLTRAAKVNPHLKTE